MPEITQEVLQEQMGMLQVQRNQAVGALSAIDGAIQLCQHLLSELNKPQETKQEQNDNGSNMDIAKEAPRANGQDGTNDSANPGATRDDVSVVETVIAEAQKKAKEHSKS